MIEQPTDNISDMDTSDGHDDTNNILPNYNNLSNTTLFNPHLAPSRPFVAPLTNTQSRIQRYFASHNRQYNSLMTSNSIRVASHNVNGLSSTQKQLALIQALEYKSLDIVGIIPNLNVTNLNSLSLKPLTIRSTGLH